MHICMWKKSNESRAQACNNVWRSTKNRGGTQYENKNEERLMDPTSPGAPAFA